MLTSLKTISSINPFPTSFNPLALDTDFHFSRIFTKVIGSNCRPVCLGRDWPNHRRISQPTSQRSRSGCKSTQYAKTSTAKTALNSNCNWTDATCWRSALQLCIAFMCCIVCLEVVEFYGRFPIVLHSSQISLVPGCTLGPLPFLPV